MTIIINVCLNVFVLLVFIFYFGLRQNKAKLRGFNFGWPLNRGKDNRKPSLGRPKGAK